MRVLGAILALAFLGWALVCFSFLFRSSDTPASTWVVFGFVSAGIAAVLAWLALGRRGN